MSLPKLPIEYCYEVIPGRFLAGEYPGNLDAKSAQKRIAAFEVAGITDFIDLTEERDNLAPYHLYLTKARHHRFPIRDARIPYSLEQTQTILDTIDTILSAGGKVYVHCWGGIGRTGVIVGCWLALHGQPGEAALAKLRELWKSCPKSVKRKSPETVDQEEYIRSFKP